jgi:ankyrin repeat protein
MNEPIPSELDWRLLQECSAGNVEDVLILLAAGADPDALVRSEDSDSLSKPRPPRPYFRLLNRTPLMAACVGKSLACVEALLAAGADPSRAEPRVGLQAMHFAAERNLVEIMERLAAAGASWDAKGLQGDDPLNFAAYAPWPACEALALLLSKGVGLESLTEKSMQEAREVNGSGVPGVGEWSMDPRSAAMIFAAREALDLEREVQGAKLPDGGQRAGKAL